jgi:hypothetical protein
LPPFTSSQFAFDDRICLAPAIAPAITYAISHTIHRQGPVHAMLEVNPLRNTIKDYTERTDVLRGYL